MSELAAQVKAQAPWYHTFDLPGGISTEGRYDLRRVAGKVPLPASLASKRCLDAAACEGFWSFELARRGADRVVSLDLPDTSEQDWQGLPTDARLEAGSGLANRHFHFVRDVLGADNVQRLDMNVYDVSPEELGSFDYVFLGNILIHLADPARALKALRSVMKPGAELLSLELNSLAMSLVFPRLAAGQLWDRDDLPRWWTPNRAAHRRLIRAGGFEVIEQGPVLLQPFGKGVSRLPEKTPTKPRELLFWTVVRQLGAASGWVRAAAPEHG